MIGGGLKVSAVSGYILAIFTAFLTVLMPMLSPFSKIPSVPDREKLMGSHLINNLELDEHNIRSHLASGNSLPLTVRSSESNQSINSWDFIDIIYENEIIHREKSTIKTQKITTTAITPLIFIPLRDDFILDVSSELQIIPVPPGLIFQTSNVVRFRTRNGKDIIFGILDNTYNYSQTGVAAILLKLVDYNKNVVRLTTLEPIHSPIITYIGTKSDIYPNKIENILIALKQITALLEKNGGFHKGISYSYLDMVGLNDGNLFSSYKDGLNKYLNPIRANGICAIATGLSALLHEKNYASYLFQERWLHKEMYRQGPFSPVRKKVDAAVEFGLNENQNYDFKWVHQSDESLEIDLTIFPTGIEFSETRLDGMAGPSDAGIIFSLSLDPIQTTQSDHIQSFLDNFANFRNSEHQLALSDEYAQYSVIYRKLNDKNNQNWAKGIFYSGDPSYFSESIKNNSSLQDVYRFSETVNQYNEGSESLYTFLRKSEWYIQFINDIKNKNINVDKALSKGTNRQIEGEPLQCVGFAMAMRDLYPDLGFPDISRATISVAGQLIPEFVYGLEGRFSTGYGEIALVGKSLLINDYSPGDLFVITGDPGHVGVVLAKNQDRLLIADSNRLWDGRVNFYYVDERNFDAVFGEEKYIIQGHYDPSLEKSVKMRHIIETLKKQDSLRLFD